MVKRKEGLREIACLLDRFVTAKLQLYLLVRTPVTSVIGMFVWPRLWEKGGKLMTSKSFWITLDT